MRGTEQQNGGLLFVPGRGNSYRRGSRITNIVSREISEVAQYKYSDTV